MRKCITNPGFRVHLLIFFVVCFFDVDAQNLVLNPGFEDHGSIECLYCHIETENFRKLTRNWDDLNSNPLLCDCQYAIKQDEMKYRRCRLDKMPVYRGCCMMEMNYASNCTDFKHETKGCASYLGTQLTTPLEIGKVYEVSYWVYIADERDIDPEYPEHIGMALYPKVVRNPKDAMIKSSGFLLDTVMYHTWYQAKWQVRPLCNLQYLVLGVFRDENWPVTHTYSNFSPFFIDEVSVREYDNHGPEEAEPIAFCKPKEENHEQLVSEIAGVTCYFDTGDSSLSALSRAALDSFALRAKQNPKVAFTITGHTDSIGGDHQALAMARIGSVLKYLEQEHRISPLRFVKIAAGNTQPATSNQTAEGRQLNRRVEILHADYDLPMVIYRTAVEQVYAGESIAAIKNLDKWLNLADDDRKLLMLFDSRLDLLKQSRQWEILHEKVKKSYSSYSEPRLAYVLDSLWAEDQKYRTLKYYIENLAVYLAAWDEGDERWEVGFPEITEEEHSKSDEAHYLALLELIGDEQWPRSSEIGERPAKAAFLIVNHHLDTVTLAHFLPLLEARCREGEAEWSYYATMYDRLCVLKGLPQRYGTQYQEVEGEGGQYRLFPLEDVAKVNEWREQLGLEFLEEVK